MSDIISHKDSHYPGAYRPSDEIRQGVEYESQIFQLFFERLAGATSGIASRALWIACLQFDKVSTQSSISYVIREVPSTEFQAIWPYPQPGTTERLASSRRWHR
jgi:hypothetical protein